MSVYRAIGVSNSPKYASCNPPLFAVLGDEDHEYLALLAVWKAGGVNNSVAGLAPPTLEQWTELKTKKHLALEFVDKCQMHRWVIMWYYGVDDDSIPRFVGFSPSIDGNMAETEETTRVYSYEHDPATKLERAAELRLMSHEGLVQLVLKLEAR